MVHWHLHSLAFSSILGLDSLSHLHHTSTLGHPLCRLADFGLSRMLDLNKTHVSTQTYGTLPFMPVELLHEGHMGKSADVSTRLFRLKHPNFACSIPLHPHVIAGMYQIPLIAEVSVWTIGLQSCCTMTDCSQPVLRRCTASLWSCGPCSPASSHTTA